jgi:hypothetical protein
VLVRSNAPTAPRPSDLPSVLITPPPSPRPAGQPSAAAVPAPETSVFTLAPPAPSPSPTPSPEPEPEPEPAPAPALRIEPAEGPNGVTVSVAGTGWEPFVEVTLEYLDLTGSPTGSSGLATADQSGSFTTSLAVQDPTGTPGDHVVRATAGDAVGEGVYRALP